MRDRKLPAAAAAIALAVVAVGCGATAGPDRAAVAVDPAATAPVPAANTAAPAAATVASAAPGPRPDAAPTGPSIRLSDGHSVVAIDPETGGRRALWPDATISLEGDWTVAATDQAAIGGSAATWMDASGVVNRSGAIPDGLVPTISSEDGDWAVFQAP
ncbi:MAG TPA: hypothetical protein VID93_01785, partial [Acidimicrobiales bacterium]